MAFSDILSNPDWEKIFLIELLLGHRIDGDSWTQHGTYTNCWYIEHDDGIVVGALERDTSYTERASLAILDVNSSSWFYDTSVSPPRLYLHMEDSDDPGTGTKYIILSEFWDYFCNSQDEDNPVIYNSQYYLPYLNSESVPDITLAVTDYYEGGVRQSFGAIGLINTDGHFDSRLTDYVYENREMLLKITYRGAPVPDVATLWRGWTGNIYWSEAMVRIDIEDFRSM